jgi:hypothetical protein
VNIETVSGRWTFIPAPGFGEADSSAREQLRILQVKVLDLTDGYQRLLKENAELQAKLDHALSLTEIK